MPNDEIHSEDKDKDKILPKTVDEAVKQLLKDLSTIPKK
jgi:hypothetical protein